MAQKINYGAKDAQDTATNRLRAFKTVKWQPLYDSTVITTARQYEFFKVPVGQADVDGTIKTVSHSNNTQAGIIPNSSRMEVFGIAIHLKNNAVGTTLTFADFQKVLQDSTAYLQLMIRKDVALELPLFRFTSGSGLVVSNRTADAGGNTTNGHPDQRNILSVLPNVVTIPEMVPFSVKITFDAIPAIVGTNLRLYVSLEGVLREPIYK